MQIFDFTLQEAEKSKGIIIYGAGAWGKIVCETLQTMNIQPRYFVDRFRGGIFRCKNNNKRGIETIFGL